MTTSETAIRLYTSREIAAILHVKPAVMDIYAGNGTGPPYRKVGKFRYYPKTHSAPGSIPTPVVVNGKSIRPRTGRGLSVPGDRPAQHR